MVAQFLRRRPKHGHRRPVVGKPDDFGVAHLLRRGLLAEQRGLATGHLQVDVGENFRVEQRAMQLPGRVVHAVAAAEGRQANHLTGVFAPRQGHRVGDRTDVLKALNAVPFEQRKLVVDECLVERCVVDDDLRAIDELHQPVRDLGKLGLVREKCRIQPVDTEGGIVDLAFRVDVELQTITGQLAVDDFHRPDFDYPVTSLGLKTRGLRIQNDLPHDSSPFEAAAESIRSMAWFAAWSTASFSA